MTPVAAVLVMASKFWILDPLYSALGTLMAWFYDVIPSFGGAIILLTIAVRLLTFPLTAKQARSQQELQRHQPEIKRLQAKYKGDKQKLNEEMMKFYKENHVNPFGGCLPLFVQFPVLIVLYRLILDLTHKPPKHIPRSSSMFAALRESGGRMVSWGMDLSQRASEVAGGKKLPFIVLVVAVMATGYYQQRQLTARLPKESANSQMAMMGKVFPVVFGFISWSIPAGVVVYFLVSNIWQIGQQGFIFRNQSPPDVATPEAGGGKRPPAGKGKPATPGKGTKGITTTRGAKGAKGGKGGGATPARGDKAGSGQKGRGPGRGAPPSKGAKKSNTGGGAPPVAGRGNSTAKKTNPAANNDTAKNGRREKAGGNGAGGRKSGGSTNGAGIGGSAPSSPGSDGKTEAGPDTPTKVPTEGGSPTTGSEPSPPATPAGAPAPAGTDGQKDDE